MNTALREQRRQQFERKAQPSAVSVDSQSVKTTAVGGERSYDSGKHSNGRKRHLLVDTLGNLLKVIVTVANRSDGASAIDLLRPCPKSCLHVSSGCGLRVVIVAS